MEAQKNKMKLFMDFMNDVATKNECVTKALSRQLQFWVMSSGISEKEALQQTFSRRAPYGFGH